MANALHRTAAAPSTGLLSRKVTSALFEDTLTWSHQTGSTRMVACGGNFQAQQVVSYPPPPPRKVILVEKSSSSRELCHTPCVCPLLAAKKSRSIHEQLLFSCFPFYSTRNLAMAFVIAEMKAKAQGPQASR